MYLNEFADSADALDMTKFDEFSSLLRSAADLGIPHSADVRYVSRNAVINHLRLHYLEWGEPDAPPVLVLHGGNQSAHSWDLVSLHLADRFHVYALDQRGHGDSEWARDSDYASEAMAADALAFLAGHGAAARGATRVGNRGQRPPLRGGRHKDDPRLHHGQRGVRLDR